MRVGGGAVLVISSGEKLESRINSSAAENGFSLPLATSISDYEFIRSEVNLHICIEIIPRPLCSHVEIIGFNRSFAGQKLQCDGRSDCPSVGPRRLGEGN